MNYIQPLSSFYLVTHHDIKKFGMDMTIRMEQKFRSNENTNNISEIIHSAQLPQISSAIKPKKIIRIRKKKKNTYVELEVDKETGIIVETNDDFSYISKFDPDSFPERENALINQVGYWDLSNNYVHAK